MKKLWLPLSALTLACTLGFSAHGQDIKGDAKAGEKKIAMCIGCHGIAGYQASFPEIYKVPKIAGQSAAYIVSALTGYQKGDRKHPTMRGMADNLSEQDMTDIAVYYAALGKVEGAPPLGKAADGNASAAALVAKGACGSCHGESLNQPIDPSYPKIAGQHADYLFVALKSYKTEGHATWGRANPIMGGVAKQFTNAELKELARYVSALPGELKTVGQSKFR